MIYHNASEHLYYDHLTGHFCRKSRMGKWPAGSRSGSALSNGAIAISLFGKSISAKKLAWYMHYGCHAIGEIQSLNGDPSDLRIANLIDQSKPIELTQELLKIYCRYEDGKLIRQHGLKGFQVGQMGSVAKTGYVETSVFGVRALVHRLVWIYHFGDCPKMLDHINGIRTDNRIENLRPATFHENAWNTRVQTRDLPLGVDAPENRRNLDLPYRTRIKMNNKVHISYHKTPSEAHNEYVKRKRELCGDFSPV